MKIPELSEQVQQFFVEHASQYLVQAESISARYILNWGGFVNHSFTVTDGRRSYHLKLADEPDCLDALRRWAEVHSHLEAHYRAPRMLDWIELPSAGHAGLLFAHIEGRTGDFAELPWLRAEVLALAGRLHQDRDLAARLRTTESSKSYLDCFAGTYIERFDGDLDAVAQDLPTFVSPQTLAWMQAEARRVEALAQEMPAFHGIADSPTHGDLWANNVLVTNTNAWYVLDWDDLALGDPAGDYALVLRSILLEAEDGSWRDYGVPAPDAAFAERMELYRRAILLDRVIDVLADYVEAHVAPDTVALVQAEKKREHLEGLRLYRQTYG